MAAPQTVEFQYVEEINSYLGKETLPDTITMARWRKSAKALLSVGAYEASRGYMLLGMIDAFESKCDAVKENFEKALQLSPRDESVELNFVTAFNNMLRGDLSMNIFREYVKPRIDAGQKVEAKVFNMLGECGYIKTACQLVEQDQLKGVVQSRSNLNFAIARSIAARMDKLGVSEADLEQRIAAVNEVMRARLGVRARVCRTYWRDYGDAGAAVEHVMPISLEEAVDVNFAIADQLAERFDDTLDRLVTFSVLPYANIAE